MWRLWTAVRSHLRVWRARGARAEAPARLHHSADRPADQQHKRMLRRRGLSPPLPHRACPPLPLLQVPFPEYAPVTYVAPSVAAGPYWADAPDKLGLVFKGEEGGGWRGVLCWWGEGDSGGA